MSQVLKLPIPDQMAEQLDRVAQRLGNGMTRTTAGVLLLQEALREAEFAGVEYRDSRLGRQPYLMGSGLAIWEVVMIARHYDLDAARMAQDYPYPVENIASALRFYAAYPDEIDQAIAANQIGYEAIAKLLPKVQLFEIPNDVIAGEVPA